MDNSGSRQSAVLESYIEDGNETARLTADFIFAARSGNKEKVLECLDSRKLDVDSFDSNGFTSLHAASFSGQEEIVKILVQHGAKVNAKSKFGFTPLYMAAQENHPRTVSYLLDQGANQNLSTEDGYTPSAVAAQKNHTQVVTLLVEHESRGKFRLQALHSAAKKDDEAAAVKLLRNEQKNKTYSVNETTKSGFTPLHIAAHYGSERVARVLLENGAIVDFRAQTEITPLHVASKWGRANVASILIDYKADMDSRTKDSLTPLHCAARSGHDRVVDLLIRRGASASSKTKNGLTALHMAAQGDHVESAARLLDANKGLVEEVTMDYLTCLHVAAHCGSVRVVKLLLEEGCIVDARALNGFTPLHIACKKNRVEVVKLLLRYSAVIDATTEVSMRNGKAGFTPLHIASFLGHKEVVVLLLENHAKVEITTAKGFTALHLATRSNQLDVVQELLQSGAHVDSKTLDNQTSLHLACRSDNVEMVRLLLKYGASKDATTKENYTALHIAVRDGREEVVQLLLENGAKMKSKTKKGFTPLHIAAKMGNVRIVKMLLDGSANPNSTGKNGLTPLHVAAHYNNPDVATLLLASGASVNVAAKNGYTALHIAAKRNELEVANILLEHGAKPNAESKSGFTALHLACQEGHREMVVLLLQRGSDANFKSKIGLTPVHITAQENWWPIAQVLYDHGADLNAETKAGYTPLHNACHYGRMDMVRFMLDNGASVNTPTKLGYTPLHQAAQEGHLLVVNLLLERGATSEALTNNGQTPLQIARCLGYVSVFEALSTQTSGYYSSQDSLELLKESYNAVCPEVMQETIESDEEGEDTVFSSTPRMQRPPVDHQLQPEQFDSESLPSPDGFSSESRNNLRRYPGHNRVQDLFEFECQSGRFSTLSSIGGGMDPLHDELCYMSNDADLRYSVTTPATAGPHGAHDDFRNMLDDSAPAPLDGEGKWHVSQSHPLAYATNSVTKSTPNSDSLERFVKSQNPIDYELLDKSSEHNVVIQESANIPLYSEIRTIPSGQTMTQQMTVTQQTVGTQQAMMTQQTVIQTKRELVQAGFLVSFIVNAKGGEYRGSRHSGVRLFIPQNRVTAPTRLTCKLVRKEKLTHPPPLMEGEGLASRILQIGPTGTKFTGPILIEVPHYAALLNGEREVAIFRSDNGETWTEHSYPSYDAKRELDEGFKDLENAEKVFEQSVSRIITDDIPVYFAFITRIRQDSKMLGVKGGILQLTTCPLAMVNFPEGALTKTIRIGLQAQVLDPDLIKEVVGKDAAFSPIVTIEPRCRKFHQSISITMPLPTSQNIEKRQSDINNPTLRLLCSLVGGVAPSHWEDVTGSSPMTITNESVTFTTNVSARFLLMESRNVSDCARNANKLYRESIGVPILAKFIVCARRRNISEGRLRVFCISEEKHETLEKAQMFTEIARSPNIQVYEGKSMNIGVSGNLETVLKDDQTEPKLLFNSLYENRVAMLVQLLDTTAPASGRVTFVPTYPNIPPKVACALNVLLPDKRPKPPPNFAEQFSRVDMAGPNWIKSVQNIVDEHVSKAVLRLTDIAEELGTDWVPLANQLRIGKYEIKHILSQYSEPREQALVMLHKWIDDSKSNANGNILKEALKQISRQDIINKCMRDVEEVTDSDEKKSALSFIDRGESLDVIKELVDESADDRQPELNQSDAVSDEGIELGQEDNDKNLEDEQAAAIKSNLDEIERIIAENSDDEMFPQQNYPPLRSERFGEEPSENQAEFEELPDGYVHRRNLGSVPDGEKVKQDYYTLTDENMTNQNDPIDSIDTENLNRHEEAFEEKRSERTIQFQVRLGDDGDSTEVQTEVRTVVRTEVRTEVIHTSHIIRESIEESMRSEMEGSEIPLSIEMAIPEGYDEGNDDGARDDDSQHKRRTNDDFEVEATEAELESVQIRKITDADEEDDGTHNEPGHDELGHDEPGHDEPGHDEPGHDEPGHDEPGHDEPEHDEPGHDEPGHDEPGHDEPGHDEPGHDEPEHDEPGHDETGHDSNQQEEELELGNPVIIIECENGLRIIAEDEDLEASHQENDKNAIDEQVNGGEGNEAEMTSEQVYSADDDQNDDRNERRDEREKEENRDEENSTEDENKNERSLKDHQPFVSESGANEESYLRDDDDE